MAWLRIDDGFTKHPKLAGWKPAQKWSLLELMEYCARYDTGGRVPADLDLLPRSITHAFLELCERSGWLDRDSDGSLKVHDWDFYNPPRADSEELYERVSELLTSNPKASANDACRALGGRRKDVLAAFKRYHAGTGSVPEAVPGNHQGTGSLARVGGRATPAPASASVPAPSPGETPPASLSSEELEPGLDTPADAAEADATTSTREARSNGRKLRPDESVVGDVPKTGWNATRRKQAEAWTRNVGVHEPHPLDALLAEFPDIPEQIAAELIAPLTATLLQTIPDDDLFG